MSSDSQKIYEARGCEVKGCFVKIPLRCKYLMRDMKCEINETKPMLCRQWPSSDYHLHILKLFIPECSYLEK